MKCIISGISICCFIFLSLSGCNESEEPVPDINKQNNGFESFEVAEVITKNCALPECHRGETAENSLSYESYSKMIEGSIGRHFGPHDHGENLPKTMHGTVYGGSPIVPFDPENSLMYNLIIGNVSNPDLQMPYQKVSLHQSEINIIRNWIKNGARDFNGNVPYSGPNKIFICNQGSDEIYVVDTDYKVVSRILDVDVNQTVIDQPHNIQIWGDYYYVTLITAGQFLKIDAANNQIVGRVTGLETPGMIMISPDGKTAYISKSSTAIGIYSIIYIIDTETMTRNTEEINLPVPGLPHAIWLSADGMRLYVANMTRDRISIVDTELKEVVDDIVLSSSNPLVYEPMHIYLSPDEKYLYVNNRTASTMMVIDTETKQILKEIPIKHHPMQAVIARDGNKIYVVSHHEPVITEITKNGIDWNITKEYENPDAFHHLYGADLSPDGKYLFVTCSNSSDDYRPPYHIPGKEKPSIICIYNTETGELEKAIDVGSYATGIVSRER